MCEYFAVVCHDDTIVKVDADILDMDICYYYKGILSSISSLSLKGGSLQFLSDSAVFFQKRNKNDNSAGIIKLHIPPDNFAYLDACELHNSYKQELIPDRAKCRASSDSEHNLFFILNRFSEDCELRFDSSLFNKLLENMHKINCYGPYTSFLAGGDHVFAYNDKTGHNELFIYRACRLKLKDGIEIEGDKALVFSSRSIKGCKGDIMKKGELAVYKKGEKIYSSVYSELNIELDRLPQIFRDVLNLVRKADKNISLNEMNEKLIHDISQIEEALALLLGKKIIIQDPGDEINWNNPNARFFTDPSKRDLIDQFFGNSRDSF